MTFRSPAPAAGGTRWLPCCLHTACNTAVAEATKDARAAPSPVGLAACREGTGPGPREGSPGASAGAREGQAFGWKKGGGVTSPKAAENRGTLAQERPSALVSGLPVLLHGPFSDRPSAGGDNDLVVIPPAGRTSILGAKEPE